MLNVGALVWSVLQRSCLPTPGCLPTPDDVVLFTNLTPSTPLSASPPQHPLPASVCTSSCSFSTYSNPVPTTPTPCVVPALRTPHPSFFPSSASAGGTLRHRAILPAGRTRRTPFVREPAQASSCVFLPDSTYLSDFAYAQSHATNKRWQAVAADWREMEYMERELRYAASFLYPYGCPDPARSSALRQDEMRGVRAAHPYTRALDVLGAIQRQRGTLRHPLRFDCERQRCPARSQSLKLCLRSSPWVPSPPRLRARVPHRRAALCGTANPAHCAPAHSRRRCCPCACGTF
ncbi:hypothetical protein C8R47DRAFT_1275823 [Mycena vitilis]|nr:hypothetical protein C8R47DRAFT_1275823 [Mycena vitilis]